MWLFPWLSFAAIAGMGAVLVAMAFTPGHAARLLGQLHHPGGGRASPICIVHRLRAAAGGAIYGGLRYARRAAGRIHVPAA